MARKDQPVFIAQYLGKLNKKGIKGWRKMSKYDKMVISHL